MKPSPSTLPPAASFQPVFYLDTILAVSLLTSDQARLGRFYADVVGLAEHSHEVHASEWRLPSPQAGQQGQATLRLLEDARAKARPPGTTGLFHTAFLLPDRPALAAATWALLRWSKQEPLVSFQGYSEHGVSEAIYGTDPDGNGVELTLDHPFARWPHGEHRNDRLNIISQPLDVRTLLQENAASPVCSAFSHVHLNVRSLPAAERLLVDEHRMQVTQRTYPGARFLAYGDYHHHLAVNVWAGTDAVAPPSGSVGLLDLEAQTPSGEAWHLSSADLARD